MLHIPDQMSAKEYNFSADTAKTNNHIQASVNFVIWSDRDRGSQAEVS